MTRRTLCGLSGAVIAPRIALASQDGVRERLWKESRRTHPDFVVYIPRHYDGSMNDSHNEHLLVWQAKPQVFMAVWTQSHGMRKQPPLNRIMFARSNDGGKTWSPPQRIAGPNSVHDSTPMASWGFPMVSRKGRIYVVFNQNDGTKGWIQMHTGRMAAVFSDDEGATWSQPELIPMPKSPYDDPEGKIAPEWIVWQIPMRDLKGGYFVGYTRWLSPGRAFYKKVENWTQIESVCEFMRFENIDAHPRPRDLRIRYSAWGEDALRVPYYRDPLLSVAQEPSLVRLPNQDLFCVMRTNSGYIWYSVSRDDGETWCNPRPLLRRDHGTPVLQPVSCCPIYQMADGRYLLLHHNQRGDIESRPENTHWPRHPAYIAVGEFRPKADQPLWFSDSRVLMATDGIGVDGTRESPENRVQTGIGIYTSFTVSGGQNVLWYPDRKCFLLGKRITEAMLEGLAAPAPARRRDA
jgi:hypothetical protein